MIKDTGTNTSDLTHRVCVWYECQRTNFLLLSSLTLRFKMNMLWFHEEEQSAMEMISCEFLLTE
jgi:hypothetical protein